MLQYSKEMDCLISVHHQEHENSACYGVYLIDGDVKMIDQSLKFEGGDYCDLFLIYNPILRGGFWRCRL